MKRIAKNPSKRAPLIFTLGVLIYLSAFFVHINGANVQPLHGAETTPEPDVVEALSAGGSTRVIVLLTAPQAGGDIRAQSQSIAQSQQEVLSTVTDESFRVIHRYDRLPGLVGEVTREGLTALQKHPEVAAVALDMPLYAQMAESAAVIRADQVWHEWNLTGAGVNIAVLDSGIDLAHPDLANDVIAQHCFTNQACPPQNADEGESAQDAYGHGTRVAGIITSQGAASPRGIAPDAGIVAVRVMDQDGRGWASDVAAGIMWVVDHHLSLNVRAINISLGGGQYAGICDEADANTQLLASAIQAARQAGIAVFVAAGNQAHANEMMMPACISGATAIGSTYDADIGGYQWESCADAQTARDQIGCFSNSSPALDLLAPGAWIETTALGGGQVGDAGTSMSAPHVAAVAALMWQANPDLTAEEIARVLQETGAPLTDPRNGRTTPRIDAYAAVDAVRPAILTGTVKLQGRADFSGVEVALSETTCAALTTTSASAVATSEGAMTQITDAQGRFTFTLPYDHPYRCLQVHHRGYLWGQRELSADQQATGGAITLLAGDLIADGQINIFDLTRVALWYGTDNQTTDLNQDGIVNLFDLMLVATNYRCTAPITEWK
ncbi:MAG: S8 family serine peptidase [Anaerolineales bacterium]